MLSVTEQLKDFKARKITLLNCQDTPYKLGRYSVIFPDNKLWIRLMRLLKTQKIDTGIFHVDEKEKRISIRFANGVYELNLREVSLCC